MCSAQRCEWWPASKKEEDGLFNRAQQLDYFRRSDLLVVRRYQAECFDRVVFPSLAVGLRAIQRPVAPRQVVLLQIAHKQPEPVRVRSRSATFSRTGSL